MDTHSIGWAVIFGLLAALAVPWFLWGSSTVVAGFPVWLWWHVGWLVLATIVFAVFARTDWGRWVTDRTGTEPGEQTP